MTGLRPEMPPDKHLAASATACRRHALMGVDKARSATSVPCAGRSGEACSAVLRGAKPARRGGRQPTPGGKRSAQLFLDAKTQQKGGKTPSGYNSPRSAKLRMALPATIR